MASRRIVCGTKVCEHWVKPYAKELDAIKVRQLEFCQDDVPLGKLFADQDQEGHPDEAARLQLEPNNDRFSSLQLFVSVQSCQFNRYCTDHSLPPCASLPL